MTEDSLPKIKVDLPMPQVKTPKLQSFSFSAEPNMPERVHRLGEYYGQSHLSFSEKVAYLIGKLEFLVNKTEGESRNVDMRKCPRCQKDFSKSFGSILCPDCFVEGA